MAEAPSNEPAPAATEEDQTPVVDFSRYPRLQIRLPPWLRDAARQRALEEGISVSQLVRRALRKYIAQ